MKSFRSKRSAFAGVVVGLLATSSFAIGGSGATTALWSDGGSLDAAPVNSGNLGIKTFRSMVWRDTTQTPAVIIDMSTFVAVPGDVLEGRQSVGVALEGANMNAVFTVAFPALTGGLAASSEGVSVAYTVHQIDDGVWSVPPGARNVPVGESTPPIPVSPGNDRVTGDLETASERYAIYVVARFDENTTARVRAETTAAISAASVTVTQVR